MHCIRIHVMNTYAWLTLPFSMSAALIFTKQPLKLIEHPRPPRTFAVIGTIVLLHSEVLVLDSPLFAKPCTDRLMIVMVS